MMIMIIIYNLTENLKDWIKIETKFWGVFHFKFQKAEFTPKVKRKTSVGGKQGTSFSVGTFKRMTHPKWGWIWGYTYEGGLKNK